MSNATTHFAFTLAQICLTWGVLNPTIPLMKTKCTASNQPFEANVKNIRSLNEITKIAECLTCGKTIQSRTYNTGVKVQRH